MNEPQSGRGLGAIRDLFRSAPAPSPASPSSRRRVSVLVRRGRDLFLKYHSLTSYEFVHSLLGLPDDCWGKRIQPRLTSPQQNEAQPENPVAMKVNVRLRPSSNEQTTSRTL